VGVSEHESRFPGWLRTLLWLIVVVWCLSAMAFVARWWLMKRTHERVQALVASGPRLPAVASTGAAASDTPDALEEGAPAVVGTAALSLPLIGPVLAGDREAYEALQKFSEEINAFAPKSLGSRVDGLLDFKAILKELGVEGADGMTQEEAAAEFLRRAAVFDGLLGQWKQALALGPWDFSGVDLWKAPDPSVGEPGSILLARLFTATTRLWAWQAEASWRTGDAGAAWAHWQNLRLNTERAGDTGSLMATMVQGSLRQRVLETVRVGVDLGGWTDGQLAALPGELGGTRVIDEVRRGLEGERRQLETWMRGIGTPGNPFTEGLVHPFNSWAANFANRLALSLTTEQQVADNLAVMHHALERPMGYFDPQTGVLLARVPPRNEAPAPETQPQSWFEKFYFMYSGGSMGRGLGDSLPHTIIRGQTGLDQARLAAALELHHRTTGQYPETLETVAAHFPGGLPVDPATGEPYRYERHEEGTYRLWGRGVDRRDDQGEGKNDVIWTGGRAPAP
jgi:hypothetical protein